VARRAAKSKARTAARRAAARAAARATRKRAAAARAGWATRRAHQAAAQRAEQAAHAKRSAAARKGWATRRANLARPSSTAPRRLPSLKKYQAALRPWLAPLDRSHDGARAVVALIRAKKVSPNGKEELIVTPLALGVLTASAALNLTEDDVRADFAQRSPQWLTFVALLGIFERRDERGAGPAWKAKKSRNSAAKHSRARSRRPGKTTRRGRGR
jgi:hypothetical protein